MHHNSLALMRKFVARLDPDEKLAILDVGSQIVPGQEEFGSYRDILSGPNWWYTGIDVSPGANVDVVVPGYAWPFPSETFDVVVSGQVIEHTAYPWLLFVELARVLRRGGLCCVIAPAVCHLHPYPRDCYRFYPDGMRALAVWAGLTTVSVELSATKRVTDTCLIAQR